ncbi:PREDICTED: inactive serine/threonine-protein kinase At1g67470-like [Populus euphratica]|uniref:Inactive serine/threonine-protein kinase At1g67470-like n=1 Tax=Populus euphratica TaxID=75702 RepID=A0AAJ6URY1_POPEU|nr:PREDICTED: inactive serine/threonine-protein kinase At1g67470-like [Populus euphratica]
MERKGRRIRLDKKMHKRERQRMFLDRGGELLEELTAFCNGRSNPIMNFSLNQLQKAIDDYHPSLSLEILTDLEDFEFKWYEGILEQRLVFIKSFTRCTKEVYRDIVVSSQMSSHNKVLKLLGCCLEIPAGPALVFEYPGIGCLERLIQDGSLTWGTRLKIAKEIANAVTYLHTAFPRPTIHRDIKPQNIFLNQNYDAKLSNFSLSISIPEGESKVEEEVSGTLFFLDPVYLRTGFVTEKTDVYSFGVLLLVLLTGRITIQEEIFVIHYAKDLDEEDQVNEIVDPRIRGKRGEAIDQQQQQAFLEVALRCTNPFSREDRPLMIEVAKELQRIERSIIVAPKLWTSL